MKFQQGERGFVLKIYLKGMEGERVTTCHVYRSFAICLDGFLGWFVLGICWNLQFGKE